MVSGHWLVAGTQYDVGVEPERLRSVSPEETPVVSLVAHTFYGKREARHEVVMWREAA
jgi:hypothetical protein